MSRRSDQLKRIEAAADRAETALARIEALLNPATPGGLSSVAADAKGARSSSEAAFAGVQALAAVGVAKPGPAELAAAIEKTGDAVRQVRDMLSAANPAPAPATVMTPAVKAPKR
jgi:hypothetical protein